MTLALVACLAFAAQPPRDGPPVIEASRSAGTANCPQPPPADAIWAVSVTPDGGSASWPPNTTNHTATFTVWNTGDCDDRYTFRSDTTGPVRNVRLNKTSALVPAGFNTTVIATYDVAAAGVGQLRLTATSAAATDGGSYNVTVAALRRVAVTPDAGPTFPHSSQTGGYVAIFTIANTGDTTDTYTLTCTGSSNVTCSRLSLTSLALATGKDTVDTAFYALGAAGAGSLTLRASSAYTSDTGSFAINVVTGLPQPPSVRVDSVNPGTTVERRLCLSFSLAPGAASECGDLRLVHALPATRTQNKARIPALIYNSAVAHPHPVVAANVTLPAGGANPDSVVATLRLGGVQVTHGKWSGAGWSPGRASRIVLDFDSLSLATGVYAYTLDVVNWYSSGPTATAAANGTLAAVNRKDSPFGAGWWLAGLERLFFLPDTTILWAGGDGSARQYLKTGTVNLWRGPKLDRPDSITKDAAGYWRFLPHGLRVRFDLAGRHVTTINRLGQQTTFTYTPSGDTLLTIAIPPATAGKVYRLWYTAGRLDSLVAPKAGTIARVTKLTRSGGRVTAIRDPDNTSVAFGYTAGDTNRIVSRTDRRVYTTFFGYDGAKKVVKDSLSLGNGSVIVRRLRPLETLGRSYGVDTSLTYTSLDGPRTDVRDTTSFWLDRFGQPRRIRDALGDTTRLIRADTVWPALVTKAVYANGRIMAAVYDDHGNVTAVTDSSTLLSGLYATTRYVWNRTWDFDSIVAPPHGDSVVMSYSGGDGNRLWQQDARGATGRTEFFYYASGVASGLLRSLRTPSQTLGSPRDSIVYDDTLGNVRKTRTPLGFWTYHYADSLGRDTLLLAPTDSAQTAAYQVRQTTRYDLADQDTLTISMGPALPYRRTPAGDSTLSAPETLLVRKYFDGEGNLDSLRRRAGPNPAGVDTLMTTRYRYDGAGRRVAEVSSDGRRDSTLYDPAGNSILQVTRLSDTLRFSYDALNRMQRRVTPAKSYAYEAATGTTTWHFPMYRADASGELNTLNGGTGGNFGLTTPADTAVFTYDSLGNIRTANNRDAQITRTYNRNGTLATETQRLRTYVGSDFTQHVYQVSYQYDRNGRRTVLSHPASLAPTPGATLLTYHYDGVGQLDTLRDVLGRVYTYTYDLEGRVKQTTGGVAEQRAYDLDGRLIRRDDAFHSDTLRYDARGKVVRAGTNADSTHTRYLGLGAVAWSQTRRYQDPNTHPEEQYVSDALGNVTHVYRRVNGKQVVQVPKDTRYVYESATGRMLQVSVGDSASTPVDEAATSVYDVAGNRVVLNRDVLTSFNNSPATLTERTRDYYGADGKLRVADRRTCILNSSSVCQTGWGTDFTDRQAFEEYRYDALGRRALLRTRGEWGCVGTECRKLIQRFVWDGDQLLYEISAPGATGETAANMERDVNQPLLHQGVFNSAHYYFTGRVAYTHGPGLDAPLGVIRMEYSDLLPNPFVVSPVTTWRGDYDNGAGLPCGTEVGPSQGDPTQDSVYTFCVEMQWPAPYLWITKLARRRAQGPVSWLGSLIEGQRDLTGQVYQRNRYYDPGSGRFTQEDPIGLAGGLNLYGFAGGDPVNFSDPFGLCPPIETCTEAERMAILVGVGNRVAPLTKLEPAMLAIASLPTLGMGEGAIVGLGLRTARGGSALLEAAGAADRAFLTSERLGHIVARHGFGSAAANAGKFAEGADIPGLIGQALKSDATLIKPGAGGRFVFEHTFGEAIGLNSGGAVTSTIRIVLDKAGKVITAFPR